MKKTARIVVTSRLRIPLFATVLGCLCPALHAQDIWTGAANSSWTNAANWQGNLSPRAGDSLIFQGSSTANNNDFASGTAFNGITFGGGASFSLAGNPLLLSGSGAGNSNGIANSSGVPQTVALNLGLDHGYYTFGGSSGGLTLAGTLTPNAGGAAYFDPAVTYSSATSDASGLISGLGGLGLMYSGAVPTPTGLAALGGGGLIVGYTYSGGNILASGSIPGTSANIELSASASTSYSLANGSGATSVNTITVTEPGNSGGTLTTTITNTGTLALGNNGGLYVLNSATGAKNALVVNGGNITAGTVGSPANLVLAVNGTTATGQAQVNSVIQDNGTGGAVSLVTLGTGSVITSKANTYTGGTYVDQGQLEVSNAAGLGSGPVYVAANATLYLANTATATFANNFYLGSGAGAPNGTQEAGAPGALIFTGGTETFSGTLNLLGAPVTAGPGARISTATTGTMNVTGKITGTGTLDFAGAHTATLQLSNTNLANPNDFQGGVIVDAPLTHAINLNLKMGADNQIPSGANAGTVTLISPAATIYSRFDLNGTKQSVGGLVGTGSSTILSNQLANFGTGPATLTIGANNTTATFVGVTSDSAAAPINLVKTGSGTQTFLSYGTVLDTYFTYHGNTTVSNGTLALAGAANIPNSPVITVAPNGILDASGLNAVGLNLSGQTIAGLGLLVGANVYTNCTFNPMLGSVGTLTMNGVSYYAGIGGNSTFVWNVTDAAGTGGSDPGWSQINITNGGLNIMATAFNPITLKIVSLTNGDVPGLAHFNLSSNQTWPIIKFDGPLLGTSFSPALFTIDTSAFSNNPASSAQFSVAVDPSGQALDLVYTTTPVITNQIANVTNVYGSTVSFTVGAAGSGVTYQWYENGTLLSSGTSSPGGATVTITTGNGGNSSTLTLAGITAGANGIGGDAGGISVNVNNSAGGSGTSIASLTVVVPPSTVSVNSTQGNLNAAPSAQGAATVLTGSQFGGNGNLTYQWYLNGTAISGATNTTYVVRMNQGNSGSYYLVATDQAGSQSNSSPNVIAVTGQVSVVPNQMIFEPFNYAVQARPSVPGPLWNGLQTTNLYNQITGQAVAWTNPLTTIDIDTLASGWSDYANPGTEAQDFYPYNTYPWPGLSGGLPYDQTCIYEDSDKPAQVNLGFGPGGSISNGDVYFSVILNVGQGGALVSPFTSPGGIDYLCGFGTGNSTSVGTVNAGVFLLEPNNDRYYVGIFKPGIALNTATTGLTNNLTAGVNGDWAALPLHRAETFLLVGHLYVSPTGSNSTCDLWIDPPQSSYYAATPPTPDVQGVAGGAPDAGPADFFYHRITSYPASRSVTLLRVGRTWASVTPPSAPALSVNSVVLTKTSNTAVFTAQNAGDPVTNYQWTFNNGSTTVTVANGTQADGSVVSGAGTNILTITGATAAEVGTYTVIGQNQDQSQGTYPTQTGTASGTLTYARPTLSIARSGASVILAWPTNAIGFALEQTSSLNPKSWSVIPTNSYTVVGTNNTYSATTGTAMFYQLVTYP